MAGKVSKLGGRSEGNDSDPASKMCEPCRDKFRDPVGRAASLRPPRVHGHLDLDRAGADEAFATRRSPPRTCAPRTGQAGRPGEQARFPARSRAASATGCSRAGRSCLRARRTSSWCRRRRCAAPARTSTRRSRIARSPAASRAARTSGPGRRDEQIQDYAAGVSNEPPRRLCETCKGVFGAIADREVRCRTSGCKNTWTWPREAQLDAAVAGKPVPKAPHRMCQRCIDLYSSLRTSSGRAAAPGASEPGPTSAARSWRARCAARPAIPIRTTAPSAKRRWASWRTAGPLQDRALPGDLDLDRGAAAGRRRASHAEDRGRGAPSDRPSAAPGSELRNGAPRRSPPAAPAAADGSKRPSRARARAATSAGRCPPSPGDDERRGGIARGGRRPPGMSGLDRRRRSPGIGRSGRRRRSQAPAAEAPPRGSSAGTPLRRLPGLPDRSQDQGDPLHGMPDSHPLAAREPAADPSGQLGRTQPLWGVQARPHRSGTGRRAGGPATRWAPCTEAHPGRRNDAR